MNQKNLVGEHYAPGSDAAKSVGLSSKTSGLYRFVFDSSTH